MKLIKYLVGMKLGEIRVFASHGKVENGKKSIEFYSTENEGDRFENKSFTLALNVKTSHELIKEIQDAIKFIENTLPHISEESIYFSIFVINEATDEDIDVCHVDVKNIREHHTEAIKQLNHCLAFIKKYQDKYNFWIEG